MKLGILSSGEIFDRLNAYGIYLRTGPFLTHIQSSIPRIAAGIAQSYADYTIEENVEFADFHIAISRPTNLRRWLRPQALFLFDGRTPPYQPLPISQAYALLEWGLNWCIYTHAHQYLIIHAAVTERGGRAVIMPGQPGAGKSTLCAALVNRGWRLLSDELTLISLEDLTVTPVPRPISLKNASIDVIRHFAPDVVIGVEAHGTVKGTVAHMRAPRDSVERDQETAVPAWIVFPKYVSGARARLQPESKAKSFMRIARSSHTYSTLGVLGFDTVASIIDTCDCYSLSYGDLAEAVSLFDELESRAESAFAPASA